MVSKPAIWARTCLCNVTVLGPGPHQASTASCLGPKAAAEARVPWVAAKALLLSQDAGRGPPLTASGWCHSLRGPFGEEDIFPGSLPHPQPVSPHISLASALCPISILKPVVLYQ